MAIGVTRRATMAGVAATATAGALPRTARADLDALADAARKEGTLTW